MVRKAALALALVASSAAGQTPARAQYKNATLGMSLTEWKALSFPGVIRPREKTVALCNDIPKWRLMDQALPTTTTEQQLGVVECGYYTGDDIGISRFLAFLPLGAEHTMFDVDYAFYHGRLFRIRGSSQLGGIGDMLDGLTAKYGKPRQSESTVQNGAGASFPKTDYAWDVGQDFVLASAPSGRVDRSAVVFLDTAADKELSAAKERIDPAADKM